MNYPLLIVHFFIMAASFQRFFILLKLIENLLNFTASLLFETVLKVLLRAIIKIRIQFIRNFQQLLEIFHIHPFAASNHTLIYNGWRRHTLKPDSEIIIYIRRYLMPFRVAGYWFCFTGDLSAVSDSVSRFYSSYFKMDMVFRPQITGKSYHTDRTKLEILLAIDFCHGMN